MKFCEYDTVKGIKPIPGVRLQSLVHGEKTQMIRFILSQGAEIPVHSHPHEQTGMLIFGRIRLIVDEKVFEVKKGDSWCIPGEAHHRVEVVEDSEVVEVFSPVREDYLTKE